MLIQQPLFPELKNEELHDERNVKTFCCVSKGLSRVRAKFEQNSFYVDQTARTLLFLDNTNCTAEMSKVKIRLLQKIMIRTKKKFSKRNFTNTVAEQEFPGIGKQESTPHGEWRFLELDLSNLIKKYLAKKKTYNKKLNSHYGDYFLQPSTEGEIINCRYLIQILPEYDVLCKKCSGPPKITLPINLGVPQDQ